MYSSTAGSCHVRAHTHTHTHTRACIFLTNAHTCLDITLALFSTKRPFVSPASLSLLPFVLPLSPSEKIMVKVSFESTHCEHTAKDNTHTHAHACMHTHTHTHTHAAMCSPTYVFTQTHIWMTSLCFLFYGGVMTELHASLCPPLPFSLSLTYTQTDTHIWSPLQDKVCA